MFQLMSFLHTTYIMTSATKWVFFIRRISCSGKYKYLISYFLSSFIPLLCNPASKMISTRNALWVWNVVWKKKWDSYFLQYPKQTYQLWTKLTFLVSILLTLDYFFNDSMTFIMVLYSPIWNPNSFNSSFVRSRKASPLILFSIAGITPCHYLKIDWTQILYRYKPSTSRCGYILIGKTKL